MPTVGSILNQNNMIGQLSHNLFKLDMAAADNSILVGGSIRTSASFLKSDFGGQPALTTMVENYTEEKSAFRSELQNAMDNLQKSSEQLKNSVQSEGESSSEVSTESSGETQNVSTTQETAQNNVASQSRNVFSVANAQTQNRQEQVRENPKPEDNFQRFAQNYLVSDEDDEQETLAAQTEDQDDRLTSVQNFVRDYNNALSYLNDNPLNRNDELTQSLNEIGISVNSSGALSVNENTLSNALQNDSEKVSSALGSDGLTGQLDFDKLNRQSENLFPTIADYANQKETDRAESLYSARNLATAAYYGIHSGNLLNTFT